MVMTTTYRGNLDAKTGDDELDDLLSEIRQKTGRSWQCEVASNRSGFLPLKGANKEKFYELLLYVGGVCPYQLILSGSGSIAVIKGYLIGYLSGYDNSKQCLAAHDAEVARVAVKVALRNWGAARYFDDDIEKFASQYACQVRQQAKAGE